MYHYVNPFLLVPIVYVYCHNVNAIVTSYGAELRYLPYQTQTGMGQQKIVFYVMKQTEIKHHRKLKINEWKMD